MATNPTTPDEQMEKEMMSMLQDTMSNLRSDSPAIFGLEVQRVIHYATRAAQED